MADENKIECPHCNYAWHSKSKKLWTCCPNCMRKFHNPNAELNPSINRSVHVKKQVVTI